jgi:serine/threonine protein phosphatase PrpC
VAQPAADGQAQEAAPLAVGTVIGDYILVRHLGTRDGRTQYLARVAGDDDDAARPHPHEPHLLITVAPGGALAAIQAVEALQLRHPRLLALRDFFTEDGRDYAVSDVPGDTWPIPAQLPLAPEEALAVGVIIGEALIYLHGSGVAHGHLSTASIVIAVNGVFLSDMEDAMIIQDQPEAVIQRDANQLAATLGAFAAGATGDSAMQAAVTAIAAKGQADGYERVEEVMADCLRSLPDGLPRLSDEAAGTAFTIQLGRATSVGMVRQQNQDALGVLVMEIFDDQPEAGPGGIFLVADGMGGEAQGEVASRIAARIIVAEVARRFLGPAARATASDAPRDSETKDDAATTMHLDTIASITEAFRAANARIRNLARRLEQATGTTATALMLFGHEVVIGHVGDSRAYLCRGGEIHQLTHDHSLVQRLIDMGHFRANEMEFGGMPRNYLYRSLGQADDLEIDTRVIKTGAGDTFLLCSDGLWDLVPTDALREILSSERTPQECAEELVSRANAAGGYDNSTALIVRFVPR